MEITNRTLGIGTSDVNECEDISTLAQWASTIEGEIAVIESSLSNAKAHYHKTGEYADPQWFASATTAKRLQGILKNQIQSCISILKRQAKKGPLFSDVFIDTARNLLAPETFQFVLNEAKARYENL